jgi:hypothetical protein
LKEEYVSVLPIVHFRKLFMVGKISREDYWLHVKSKLEILEDIGNSFFDSSRIKIIVVI